MDYLFEESRNVLHGTQPYCSQQTWQNNFIHAQASIADTFYLSRLSP